MKYEESIAHKVTLSASFGIVVITDKENLLTKYCTVKLKRHYKSSWVGYVLYRPALLDAEMTKELFVETYYVNILVILLLCIYWSFL
jgi:hypothetical protein